MEVKALMTREAKTCTSGDTLDKAARLMWEHDIGSVVVVSSKDVPIGMITDRDICMAAYTQGRPLAEIQVASAMSKSVRSCEASDDVSAAEETMRRHQIHRLPVVGQDKRLVGVLSLHDLAVHFSRTGADGASRPAAEEVARTLAAICAPHGQRESANGSSGAANGSSPAAAKPERRGAGAKT